MQYGLYSLNQDALSHPEAIRIAAQAAEAVGFDSLWMGEHVVLPNAFTPPPYMAPKDPILDPIVTLSFVAAHTNTILLGTGVLILPQRNPVVLAKELASLDGISNGRLIFGIGVGYLEQEMSAVGIPMGERGIRTDEYLDAMLALWTQTNPSYQGRFVKFDNVQAYPHPEQSPHPPIVIGGHSRAAHRRAVRYGNGWYGFNLGVKEASLQVASLREMAHRYARDPELGELEINITPSKDIDLKTILQYNQMGVHRLIFTPPRCSIDKTLAFIHSVGEMMTVAQKSFSSGTRG